MNEGLRFGKYLRGAMICGDYVILNLAYLLTMWIAGPGSDLGSRWVWLIANVAFVLPELLFSGIHVTRIFYADRVVLSAFKSTVVLIATLLTLLYIFDIFHVPLADVFLFSALFFILLSLWWISSRKILKKVRRMGFNYRNTIVVGAGSTGRDIISELESDEGYGYRMAAVFDDDRKALGRVDAPFKGSLDDVRDFLRTNKVDIIYYTLSAENHDLIRRFMLLAEEEGADFVYVPKFHKILSGQFILSSVGNLPVLTKTHTPLNLRRNRAAKRLFDLAVSVPFLIISPLIFIPIAVGIKMTSPGPVFFRQRRTGIHGTEFICYKFRTMRVNKESDTVQATENDPRKTAFGDFLRRSSLDELPQFYNVLIGNMSVVGPRPHMVSHTEEYSALIDKYMVRHSVKPGITGWAQVNGYRGGTKHLWQMEKRVEYDVWYIRNWNIFLDLKIMFLTVFNGLRGEDNAY